MSETKKSISLLGPGLDHLKTDEGAKRFNDAVEQRNQADFECFMVLRDLAEEDLISYQSIYRALKALGGYDEDECKEVAEYQAERVKEALEKRRAADREFSDALLGR